MTIFDGHMADAILARAFIHVHRRSPVPTPGVFVRVRRLSTAAVAAVFAVAGLAACSDDEGADNTKTEAKALADQAVAEMKKMNLVKAVGKGKDDEGKDMVMDMCADLTAKALAAKGTMGGYAVEMIQVGEDRYMKADAKYWATFMGDAEDPAVVAKFEKVLGGKFVQTKDEAGDNPVDFFEGDTNGVTKGEVTEFQGKKVVPLTKTVGDDKSTYYVAAKGAPVIVGQLEEGKDGSRDETSYSKADKCEAKAPAKDQTILSDDIDAALEADS
jgi:hypothetical protein